jgi:uncharacterized sulfatase
MGNGATNTTPRGAKATTFAAASAPAVMRFPGHLKAGSTSRQVMTMMDYSRRSCRLRRAPSPPPTARTWPAITGGRTQTREDLFFVNEGANVIRLAVHHGEWKLVREERRNGETANYLFQIENDPNEEHDLAAKNPKLVDDLARRIAEWRKLHPPDGVREGPAPAGYKAPPMWVEAARE